MMRELKALLFFCSFLTLRFGCSPNPYDEGTESLPSSLSPPAGTWAAAQIPMMRELKDNIYQ